LSLKQLKFACLNNIDDAYYNGKLSEEEKINSRLYCINYFNQFENMINIRCKFLNHILVEGKLSIINEKYIERNYIK
jgi:hypothetical protein